MRTSYFYCYRLILLSLATALLTGCVSTNIEQARQTSTQIGEHDTIVILGRTDHTDKEAEKSFTRCIERSLAGGQHPLQLVPADQFIDEMFPWFEPRLAPTSTVSLSKLLAKPGVSEQIAKNNVHYIVWIDGNTETTDQGGGLSCAIGPGGGGCLGLTWWERESSYEASIWDVENVNVAGSISTDTTGKSYIAGVILPIPLIARTSAAACRSLAQQLKSFIIDE